MNVGALATIAVMNPPNLAIVCVDNGHYEGNGTPFVLLRVKPADPPAFKRKMDPSGCCNRFRTALLGAA
jgi:phosphonopyruvate decarboxylase